MPPIRRGGSVPPFKRNVIPFPKVGAASKALKRLGRFALPRPIAWAWDAYDLYKEWERQHGHVDGKAGAPDTVPAGWQLTEQYIDVDPRLDCLGGTGFNKFWMGTGQHNAISTCNGNGVASYRITGGGVSPQDTWELAYQNFNAIFGFNPNALSGHHMMQQWRGPFSIFQRCIVMRLWYRPPSPDVNPHPWVWPALKPIAEPGIRPLPFPYPGIVPPATPIQQPSPTLRPPPYRWLPHLPSSPDPWGRQTGPRPGDGARPLAPPGGLRPPLPPRDRPPRPREKERKVGTHVRGLGAVLRAVGAVTEGLDALYAVWDAMPSSVRKGWNRPPPQVAFGRIYGAWEKGEVTPQVIGNALWNLVKNQAEDAVYGTVGNLSKRATKNNPFWFSPVGPSTGPAL